jgi:hypothetical protein
LARLAAATGVATERIQPPGHRFTAPLGPRRLQAMKKLVILALLIALGVVAARRLRET